MEVIYQVFSYSNLFLTRYDNFFEKYLCTQARVYRMMRMQHWRLWRVQPNLLCAAIKSFGNWPWQSANCTLHSLPKSYFVLLRALQPFSSTPYRMQKHHNGYHGNKRWGRLCGVDSACPPREDGSISHVAGEGQASFARHITYVVGC